MVMGIIPKILNLCYNNLMNKFIKTNNYSERDGNQIKAIVCHITDGTNQSVIYEFTNSKSKKSAHYLIKRTGDIIQFVDEKFSAWHVGYKVNPIAKLVLENINLNPNLYTIGIEHEAFSNQDLTEIQYVNSAKLINEICQRHGIPKDREYILRHHEIRQDKSCPALVSVEKLIGLTFNPPAISEIDAIKVKISLLQKLLELLKSIASFPKLGKINDDERGEL